MDDMIHISPHVMADLAVVARRARNQLIAEIAEHIGRDRCIWLRRTKPMTDAFTRLICREAGAGGGGRRKRTRGPRRRPHYTAHPAEWWDADVTAAHLRDCRTGRGPDGEWKPWRN